MGLTAGYSGDGCANQYRSLSLRAMIRRNPIFALAICADILIGAVNGALITLLLLGHRPLQSLGSERTWALSNALTNLTLVLLMLMIASLPTMLGVRRPSVRQTAAVSGPSSAIADQALPTPAPLSILFDPRWRRRFRAAWCLLFALALVHLVVVFTSPRTAADIVGTVSAVLGFPIMLVSILLGATGMTLPASTTTMP